MRKCIVRNICVLYVSMYMWVINEKQCENTEKKNGEEVKSTNEAKPKEQKKKTNIQRQTISMNFGWITSLQFS